MGQKKENINEQITYTTPDTETTVELVTALQNGEPSAADAVFEAFHNDIYFFILKSVKDSELASHLTQDTFAEINANIGTLAVPSAFLPWCKKIAQKRYVAHIKKRQELLLDDKKTDYALTTTYNELEFEFFPDENVDSEDLRQTICDMLDALPEKLRTALIMRYYDELSIKDIAKIQKTSERTVTSRLTEGRSAIEQSIEAFEKKHNIKLENTGIIPIILWFFREDRLKNGISLTEMTPAAKEALANLLKNAPKLIVKKIAIRVTAALIITIITGIFVHFSQKEPVTSLPHSSEIPNNQIITEDDSSSGEILDSETNSSNIETDDNNTTSSETESSENPEPENSKVNDTQLNDSQTNNADSDTENNSKEDETKEEYPETVVPEEAPEQATTSDGLQLSLSADKTFYTVNLSESQVQNLVIPAEYKGVKITTIAHTEHTSNAQTSITLSDNITHLLPEAFSSCTDTLTDIYYNGTMKQWNDIEKGEYWGGGKENFLLIHCSDGNIERIPTEGLDYALSDDGTYYTLSSSANCYGDDWIVVAEEINGIPVTVIGPEVFWGRFDIKGVSIPNSIIEIKDYAFSDCKFKSFKFSDNIKSIGYGAFSLCEFTSITLPDGLESLAPHAFSLCYKLESLTIPSSVISISDTAIAGCEALKYIEVEKGNPVYHSSGNCIIETQTKTLIAGCSISTIPTDGSVTIIGPSAFYYDSLTNFIIPEGITSIEAYAFYGCEGLSTISLPSTLTYIGTQAFGWCDSLTDIYYNGTISQWYRVKIGIDYLPQGGNYTIHCTDGDTYS